MLVDLATPADCSPDRLATTPRLSGALAVILTSDDHFQLAPTHWASAGYYTGEQRNGHHCADGRGKVNCANSRQAGLCSHTGAMLLDGGNDCDERTGNFPQVERDMRSVTSDDHPVASRRLVVLGATGDNEQCRQME
jgi:hypothetical protein